MAQSNVCSLSYMRRAREIRIFPFVTGGVRELCEGESRDYLESVCMMLPDDDECYSGKKEEQEKPCGPEEFACGDECVHGSAICDRKFDCRDHSDELKW